MRRDHATIIYEFSQCREETRTSSDPECASQEEIDEWLKYKKILI